jgi:hypothetical protein
MSEQNASKKPWSPSKWNIKELLSRGAKFRGNGKSEEEFVAGLTQRFEKYFSKTDGECWEWNGTRGIGEYGAFYLFYIEKRSYAIAAYRFSFYIYKGIDPGEKCVCHTCDNQKCVNPDHLWLGTVSENFIDMHKKKRGYKYNQPIPTQCPIGHPFTEENTFYHLNNPRRPRCRICYRSYINDRRRKQLDGTWVPQNKGPKPNATIRTVRTAG